jgi:hypothetical protein
VAWLVFLIAVPLWAWSNIEKVDIEPKGERPAEQPGSNYLLVGSDSRKGLTKAEAKRLGTGSEDVGNRTDTIMLCQGERAILETTFRYPGDFMFHAHQSEFAELGWMGLFRAEVGSDT